MTDKLFGFNNNYFNFEIWDTDKKKVRIPSDVNINQQILTIFNNEIRREVKDMLTKLTSHQRDVNSINLNLPHFTNLSQINQEAKLYKIV